MSRSQQSHSQAEAQEGAHTSTSASASGSHLHLSTPTTASTSTANAAPLPNPPALAPILHLPRQNLVSIEYPGILSSPDSLQDALLSLDPSPPPFATARRALVELGRSVTLNRTFIECRLGAGQVQRDMHDEQRQQSLKSAAAAAKGKGRANADGDEIMQDDFELSQTTLGEGGGGGGRGGRGGGGEDSDDEEQSTSPSRAVSGQRSTEAFRHPLIGAFLPSYNPICRLRKRIWRRPKPGGAPGEFEERKEYTYEFLGAATRTARFRAMADFSYEPDLEGAAGGEAKSSGTLDLLDALARMDVRALRHHSLGREEEIYEVGKGKNRRSNLQLPPPPLFSLQNTPFLYGFRQNTSSMLHRAPEGEQGVGPMRRDGTRAPSRFENRLRVKGLAPKQFGFGDGWSGQVPDRPSESLEPYRKEANAALMQKLKELFEERPVWSRLALLNQLKSDWRRDVYNQKYYLSLHCYTIVDGPWRDCLVRFGYDVREHKEARLFQKLVRKIRSGVGDIRGPLERGRFKTTHGVASASASGVAGGAENGSGSGSGIGGATDGPGPSPALDREEGDGEGEGEGDHEAEDQTPSGEGEENSTSHIFDGEHSTPNVGTFQLCDISDKELKPFIESDDLRDSPDMVTGWYSALAWEKISTVFSVRFHTLMDKGVPADKQSIRAGLEGIRLRNEMLDNMAAQALLNGVGGTDGDGGESGTADIDVGRVIEELRVADSGKGRGRGRGKGTRTGTGTGKTNAKGRGKARTSARSEDPDVLMDEDEDEDDEPVQEQQQEQQQRGEGTRTRSSRRTTRTH